jgi:uncharacterized membrane protein
MDFGSARISKTWYEVRRYLRRLWVRAGSIALLALVAAWAARPLGPLIPEELASGLGGSALLRILEILASSMLAVTIFSLSIMVQARQSASTQVTPRSYRLLVEDPTTQTTLATFLGAFIFALVSLIVVSTEFYGARSAAVIMLFTLVVIALVVLALLRWIEHLSDLGSVLHTSERVERAAHDALAERRRWPQLGARALDDPDRQIPGAARPLRAPRTGYVCHVDLPQLSAAAEAGDAVLWVVATPGRFVARDAPLLHAEGEVDMTRLLSAFTIEDSRQYDQDPSFGIIVLSEIAQRALSPGLNDPGTAIDIIGRLVRLLLPDDEDQAEDVLYPRIWMPPLRAMSLMQDGFAPIARDGAGMIEVALHLQKGLAALAAAGDPDLAAAARKVSRRALDLSNAALPLEEDRARVRAAAPARPPSPAED